MLKAQLVASIAVALLMAAAPAGAQSPPERTSTRAHDTRAIEFPATAAGDRVLAVDTHTHTLFSDGLVWPTIRLWEAERDHLAAYALTDHLEARPHKGDVLGDDRNRPYAIATAEAARIKSRVQPINGAEITRELPWGHFNVLFVTDVNAIPVGDLKSDPRPALRAARGQGAVIIWNHPWAYPGLDRGAGDPMPAGHRALLADGLMDAVEIANSAQYSSEAFDMALKHGLAVVGASDVHGLIDSDLQIPEGQHRTTTLVLAPDASIAAIRDAVLRKRTAALFRQALYGRERELSEIVGGALRIAGRRRVESFLTRDVVELEVRNDASIPFHLRFDPAAIPLTASRLAVVPARGKLVIQVANVSDLDGFTVKAEVLNAFIEPGRNLALTLR